MQTGVNSLGGRGCTGFRKPARFARLKLPRVLRCREGRAAAGLVTPEPADLRSTNQSRDVGLGGGGELSAGAPPAAGPSRSDPQCPATVRCELAAGQAGGGRKGRRAETAGTRPDTSERGALRAHRTREWRPCQDDPRGRAGYRSRLDRDGHPRFYWAFSPDLGQSDGEDGA